jgi:putative phosphoribosyl transferase
VHAVVSRGGRPDLAGPEIDRVTAPTLFIVGGEDHGVRALNERARPRLRGVHELKIVPRATHLFPEPGAMTTVIGHALAWFDRHLASAAAAAVEAPAEAHRDLP